LNAEVESGVFRKDLRYRLNVFPITMPPLRERREDIPLLLAHFVARFPKGSGRAIESIPTATINSLENYTWPGNVSWRM
jgi:transcriptional regulator with GAF, ATPase, and Fis domain